MAKYLKVPKFLIITARVKLKKEKNKKNKKNKGVVSQCGLAIYIKKYLKAKEELWKLKYFTMQKYKLKKKSFKRNQKTFKILL